MKKNINYGGKASVVVVADNVTNPVLSKIKVNDDSRYTL